MPLPKALPPIVREAIILVTSNDTIKGLKLNLLIIFEAMVIPAEPDKIPQISPITSYKN